MIMTKIKRIVEESDLISPEIYAKNRKQFRNELVQFKKNRRIPIGPHATFYFESFETMLGQIQEMLHIEKGGKIHLHDGSVAQVNKDHDHDLELTIKLISSDSKRNIGDKIDGEKAEKLYYASLYSGTPKVTYGAPWFEDGEHWLPTKNEYGPQQYAHFFFFITGFHGFHVFSGVLINILIFIGVVKGTYHKRGHYEMVEKTGLYWHFVDLVWVFVFTFFYLV